MAAAPSWLPPKYSTQAPMARSGTSTHTPDYTVSAASRGVGSPKLLGERKRPCIAQLCLPLLQEIEFTTTSLGQELYALRTQELKVPLTGKGTGRWSMYIRMHGVPLELWGEISSCREGIDECLRIQFSDAHCMCLILYILFYILCCYYIILILFLYYSTLFSIFCLCEMPLRVLSSSTLGLLHIPSRMTSER